MYLTEDSISAKTYAHISRYSVNRDLCSWRLDRRIKLSFRSWKIILKLRGEIDLGMGREAWLRKPVPPEVDGRLTGAKPRLVSFYIEYYKPDGRILHGQLPRSFDHLVPTLFHPFETT
jgi:hypothetical protein